MKMSKGGQIMCSVWGQTQCSHTRGLSPFCFGQGTNSGVVLLLLLLLLLLHLLFSLFFCCCQNQSSGTDFALKQGQGDKTCEVATKIKKPSILTHKFCPPGCFGQGTNVVRESGDKCHMEVAKGAQSLCGSCKKGQNLGS